MIPVLDTKGARAFDAHHIDKGHVPSLVLMENAGRGAAEVILGVIRQGRHDGPVAIVCGAGNNGGDGFVVARHLAIAGLELRVFFVGDEAKLTRDARAQRDAFVGTSGAFDAAPPTAGDLSRCTLVVDALFGTGLARDLEGEPRRAVETINGAGKPVVALDLPSGIDADTGEVHGVAVRAAHTVTFGTRKIGLYTTKGAEHSGTVHLAHIGVPAGGATALPEGVEAVAELLEPNDVARWIVPRSVGTHKHAVGQVVLFCGTPGTLGAAWMASEGALRTGAGSVTIATFPDAVAALQSRVVEAMTTPIDVSSAARLDESVERALKGKKVALVGPGFGTDDRAREVILRLLASELPLVMDADALTLLAKKEGGAGGIGALGERKAATILTPHAGELGRLLGITSLAVEADRVRAVKKAQELAGERAVVVLKGPRTLIAGAGRLAVNDISSPALATAGSGDTLAGITTTFACWMGAFEAACSGVLVHGMTSVRWSKRFGDRGLLASDVASGVPETLVELAALRHLPGG
jgi:NAD(P)H-hydrate epimerase